MADPFTSALIGSMASIGLPNFAMNQFSSAINSHRAWKYAKKAMALQDKYNRNMIKDYYSLNRQSLENADYNPLLAIPGSTANGASYSPTMMNADSDMGDQAVNSAMTALTTKANVENVKEQTEKTKEEKKSIELDNRLKKKQLNTDPKAIISDLAEGEDTPITKLVRNVANKLGLPTSAISTPKQTSKVVNINLSGKNPYVQKGIPRSVVKSFAGKTSAVSQQDSRPFIVLTDNQVKKLSTKKYSGFYNKPPKYHPY